MIAVVVCREDTASMNIGRALQHHGSWRRTGDMLQHGELLLHHIDDMHLYHDGVDHELAAHTDCLDAVVFASRHRSRSGRKTLSVHPIGNYRDADYGGRDETLVPSAPGLMHSALQGLYDHASMLDYDVCYEVTHHGPFLATPTFFIETGSTEREWRDMAACEAVAAALLNMHGDAAETAIGLGGGHYAPRFTDLALKEDVAFGHMIPDYQLPHLDEAMVQAAIDATAGVSRAFLHGGKGERFWPLLEENGLDVVSV
jgi:D-tyrosyl-tRNA(Tyr) deacylase